MPFEYLPHLYQTTRFRIPQNNPYSFILLFVFMEHGINPLTPNDPYSSRTAPLTYKVVFYIFIQQI
jgi:hypothetical protein